MLPVETDHSTETGDRLGRAILRELPAGRFLTRPLFGSLSIRVFEGLVGVAGDNLPGRRIDLVLRPIPHVGLDIRRVLGLEDRDREPPRAFTVIPAHRAAFFDFGFDEPSASFTT